MARQSRDALERRSVPGDFDLDRSLATAQVEAMAAAWRRGERPRAEVFLAAHPELGDDAAIRLIYEEFCLGREAGLEIDSAEIALRFPQWRVQLELLLDCQDLLMAAPAPAAVPEVGERLGEFRLLAELGRGVSGRVFLASQPALADRPVVLKVTASGREEHLSLARLQHMNIVSLYSEQFLPGRGLRILCMPFLGGATLDQVLEVICEQSPARRTGRQIVAALDQIQERRPVVLPGEGPFRRYLTQAAYVEAIVWIGACLADGLQFAHERGLVHLDIKPSNVLLTSDGQPMLLDFHLARAPLVRGDFAPARLGGTPGYAAPEQLAAMAAIRDQRCVEDAVDGRADVYALGVVLTEALGGASPNAGVAPLLPLRRRNPRVSAGLSDILAKCVCPDPAERYRSATALAADLRRHLEDQPLCGVPNRSPTERWRKWRRRRPYGLGRGLAVLVSGMALVAATVLIAAAYRERIREIDAALAEGRGNRRQRQLVEAAAAFRRGLRLTTRTPGLGGRRRVLEDELKHTWWDAKGDELHHLAELVRFCYAFDPPTARAARELAERAWSLWEVRASLVQPLGDHREPSREYAIRTDLRDVMVAWADTEVRLAPAREAMGATHKALDVLNEVAALVGPGPALNRDRRAYARALGMPVTPTPDPEPRSAWEHYDLGRSQLRTGELALADAQFQAGLHLRPQDFWLNFSAGLCAYRLGRYGEAAECFRVCVALAPETAECHYNRALAEQARGRADEAMRAYSRALELDPGSSPAALNRGILHYQAGRYADADEDLRRALACTDDRDVRGTIHFNLALVALSRGTRDAAFAELKAAEDEGNTEASALHARLRRRRL
jgi:serine/threonine protein kinase/tetratricopeptide (TPR) repeat protein